MMSLCNLTLCLVCGHVCVLQRRSSSCWRYLYVSENLCQSLVPVGYQHQLLEEVGVSNIQPLGQGWCVFPKTATGGTEVSEGLSSSSWSRTKGVCACCQLVEMSIYAFPKLCVCGLPVDLLANPLSWTRQWVGSLRSRKGYQVGREFMLVSGGTCMCGESVRPVCECYVFAESTQLDQPVSQRPLEWVEGAGIRAVVPGGQKGHDSAEEIHKCACACQPVECGMCPALVTSYLCQHKRRRRHGYLGLCLVWVQHMGAAQGSGLSVVGWVTSCACHLLCVCPWHWNILSGLLLVKLANVISHVPQPGQRLGFLGTGLGSSSQAGGVLGQSSWRRWPCS